MFGNLYAVVFGLACAVSASQTSAPKPLEAPLRELEWGQVNFLHTTDTHGWHAGHLQEASYGADWGDYVDFARCMRENAEAKGRDLLVVDTGDRIEGNGLYDASDPKGEYTFKILKEQHIDLICSGNHELYHKGSAEDEYQITVPDFKNAYLASNLDIQDPETGKFVPLAPRYKKFTTKKQDIRIMAFGFLFDFSSNFNNTIVQPVENAVKEDWFQEAIRDREIDLFVVIGHAPARGPEFEAIFKAIRAVQWDTPIQFLGGHWHVRDYRRFDSTAYALTSGRYMETIGFQSIDGLATGGKPKSLASPKFFRRYIDNNLYSLYHHSHRNASSFHSEHGQNVSKAITAARKALNLDERFGCAKQDLWMFRAPYPSNSSVYTWLEERVMPDMVRDEERGDRPRVVIQNTGGIRFDIFKGPFTRDSTFIVIPFTSGFRYIKDVPFETAKKLLPLLNSGSDFFADQISSLQHWRLAPPEQRPHSQAITSESLAIPDSPHQHLLTSKPSLTPGYTTKDDAGSDGDDTVHSEIPFYRVPNCIQSIINAPSTVGNTEDEQSTILAEDSVKVDVVFNEFLQPWILLAFRFLGLEFSDKDTAAYMESETFTTLLEKWVRENWSGDC